MADKQGAGVRGQEQFLAMMDNIKAAAGQGRFGCIWSEASRGKTDTYYAGRKKGEAF